MNSKKCEVDGDLLLSLDENDLKDDLKMDNGILRKKFTRELNNLKKNADYSCVDQSGVASFLSSIDHKCYSYNLIKAAMDPQYMKKLNASDLDDMLKNDAKISSKFHRHQIIEACHENNSMGANHAGQYPNVITEEVDSAAEHNQDHYDVYLTYAGSNHGIKEVASLLAIELQLRGFRIFNPSEKQMLDDSDHDHYSQESIVKKCKNLVVVLGPGALDGCILDHHSKDSLHRVIKSALHEKNLKIIPVSGTVARVSLGQEKSDSLICEHSLLHWETLLVVSTGDAQLIALELISKGVTIDLLAHPLLVEGAHFQFIVDFDQFLAASGRKRQINLHFHATLHSLVEVNQAILA